MNKSKESNKLKNARKAAAKSSRLLPDKKIYIQSVYGETEAYIITGKSGENVLHCYKNGSEIAI